MKRVTLATLVFATTLFAIPALSHAQLTINLRDGTVDGWDTAVRQVLVTRYTVAPSPACPTGNWWKAFVTLDLTPITPNFLPRTAFFTVEYEGTPVGWTVDIGDAATDDGFGGADVGDNSAAAEVQVVNQLLSVFDFNRGIAVNDLLSQPLSLTNGSLKFGVADQKLAIGQPRTVLASTTLYQIPDGQAQPPGTEYYIYSGFNHVVKQTREDRIGCGARFVTIWTGTNPPGV